MKTCKSILFLSTLMVLLAFSGLHAKAPDRTGKLDKPSGLTPLFPTKASCPEIASPFGSSTRYDGSRRPSNRFGGKHGGIDLSLDEGTPLLAMAAGTLVAKGKGKRMEGIYLWLLHSPEDTGLSYWIFTKYQHLKSLPELPLGSKVSLGQKIGFSGKTGTTGGHYGFSGYPHLHFSTAKSSDGKYKLKQSNLIKKDTILIDPLTVYHEAGIQGSSEAFPAIKGTVLIPFAFSDGSIWPSGTRVVWPVPCQPQ